jgi:hypothetical protein
LIEKELKLSEKLRNLVREALGTVRMLVIKLLLGLVAHLPLVILKLRIGSQIALLAVKLAIDLVKREVEELETKKAKQRVDVNEH